MKDSGKKTNIKATARNLGPTAINTLENGTIIASTAEVSTSGTTETDTKENGSKASNTAEVSSTGHRVPSILEISKKTCAMTIMESLTGPTAINTEDPLRTTCDMDMASIHMPAEMYILEAGFSTNEMARPPTLIITEESSKELSEMMKEKVQDPFDGTPVRNSMASGDKEVDSARVDWNWPMEECTINIGMSPNIATIPTNHLPCTPIEMKISKKNLRFGKSSEDGEDCLYFCCIVLYLRKEGVEYLSCIPHHPTTV